MRTYLADIASVGCADILCAIAFFALTPARLTTSSTLFFVLWQDALISHQLKFIHFCRSNPPSFAKNRPLVDPSYLLHSEIHSAASKKHQQVLLRHLFTCAAHAVAATQKQQLGDQCFSSNEPHMVWQTDTAGSSPSSMIVELIPSDWSCRVQLE